MVHYSAYSDDDPARFMVRRPAKRASSGAWVLKMTTACLVVTGLLALANLALNWSQVFGGAGRISDPTPIAIFIGKERMTIPANMFRFAPQRNTGPHEHVDLAVHWPSLEGYSLARRHEFLDGSANAPMLFLAIKRRQTASDSAGRLNNIYRHFFDDVALPAPVGLIGRRLADDSGLAGEEIYFEAGAANPFTVHCLPEDGSGYPAPCLTELHVGSNLSVQLRFRRGLLKDWTAIKSATRALLMSFGLSP